MKPFGWKIRTEKPRVTHILQRGWGLYKGGNNIMRSDQTSQNIVWYLWLPWLKLSFTKRKDLR